MKTNNMSARNNKTINLKISEDLYEKIANHCRKRGLDVQEYIEETLIERLVRDQL